MRRLIGLHGAAGCGEDTVGAFLTERYGCKRRSFGDLVRKALEGKNVAIKVGGELKLLKDLVKLLGWEQAKRLIPGVREALQDEGEGNRGVLGGSCYANAERFHILGHPDDSFVWCDVRAVEEAEMLREQGAIILEITRPGFGPPNERSIENRLPQHLIDATIRNNSDIPTLHAAIERTIESLPNIKRALAEVENVCDPKIEREPGRIIDTNARMSHVESVRRFNELAGNVNARHPSALTPETRKLACSLILEEVLEFCDNCGIEIAIESEVTGQIEGWLTSATMALHPRQQHTVDLAEIADDIGDIRFVNTGNALRFGIDMEPVQQLIDDANLRKFGPGGYRNEIGKWIKPPDFIPPDEEIAVEIERQIAFWSK